MKSKHLLLLLLLAIGLPWAANAQSLGDYTFSTGTDNTKWVTLTSSATSLLTYTSYTDSKASDVTNIGFSFPFGESTYSQFSVNTDGNLRLGSTVTGTSNYYQPFGSNVSYNTPKINAFGCDGALNVNGHYVKSELVGDNLLVVEFSIGTYTSSTRSMLYKWQIQLHSNGDIEIVFPDADNLPETNPAADHQCGMCVNSADGWVITLSNNTATHFTSSTTTTNASGTWFDANRYYRFERPVIAYPKPTNLQVTGSDHESASFSWAAPEQGPNTLTGYAYQYKKASDTDWPTSWTSGVNASATTLTIHGLEASTSYNFRFKALYGSNESDIVTADFSTTAQATAVGDSWSDNFEGASCGWELINGTLTNKWTWGTAANNGGTHGLYISNDNGTSNAYSHSATMVYATKLLNFTESKYEFTYDWKANGESTFDYLRVALVPASVTLTAGTTPSGFSSSGLPTGWIALDGGSKLNQVTAWQSKSLAINVTAGNYYLVMAWKNDGNGGTQPPAAVDNVSITRVACPYDVTGLTVSGITTSGASLSWTAGEATQWQVAYATTSNFASAHEEIVSAATYPMASLTDATHYYVKVRAYCGGTDYGSWSNVVEFDTKCLPTTVSSEGWTENFDGLTVASDYTAPSARVLPMCWSAINTTTYTSYKPFPTAYYNSSTNYAKSTPNCLKFYSYYSSSYSNYDPQPQYAILPEMDNLAGMRIKLWARGYNATSTFKIGRMTDPEDASTFVQIGEEHGFTSENYQTYQEITVELTGTGNYIAIMIDAANSSRSTNGIYIDDIIVEPIPSCTEPSGLECTATTTTTATLHWTAGGTEAAWDLYVSTTNTAPTNSTTPTVSATTNNPATVPGLTASTKYYAWVRAHCSDSDQSPWVGGISFITDCEARTIDADHHYTENFNDYTAGTTGTGFPSTYPNDDLPLCWEFINRSETSDTYPAVFLSPSTDYAVSGNCLFFKSSNTTPIYAILPEFTNNISDLMLTFTYRNEGTSGSNGTLVAGYMTDPTDATTFDTVLICDRTTTLTEKEVFFENAPAGSYIAFKYQGGSSSNFYLSIDDVEVELAPSCRKPSDLTKDATTAHTATLHWTNGSTDQNAWQIAYSTTADFDPSTVTPVDVTTNPATIEGLAQSTTYYAYVRAYCGGTDYSAWNSTKVTFSTIAGNVTPTGLAVDASTITSSQATASWNAVAGNTLHEYYQIYWAEATVTSVPDEPAAPNLITNITATSQLIEGLNPETQYKVWVRDICGTDGNSAWSSAVTFTTAASCQNPDGLAANNVTNESATITWNTYGQEGFNLQYRISGEEWDANNIIPNVSTPYTLNPPLIGSTTYEVRVQAACTTDDSWSSALSFKTQCDPVSFPWSENFDEWESKSECWSFLSGQYNNGNGPATTYSSAWTLNSSYGSYITLSGKALTMNLYSTYKYWAVTPIIDITTDDALLTVDVAVAAWSSATPNFDDNDTLAFAISTNGGATFTSLRVLDGAELNTLGNSYTTIYVPVTGYNGQAVRFAIFGGSINNVSSNDNRCVIDNVTVMETPSCYPVGTLSAATDVTYNSAKLSWALVDDTQDEWTVQYATNATFTEGVGTETATTNTNYELTDLTPETHYWVRVKAACSTTDDWSNAVDFTTDVFCAVTGLTAGTTTQTTADLSWTGASDSYNIRYRTAVQPGTVYLSEKFENGIPTNWDNTVHSSSSYVWNVGSTSGSGHSNGTQNAYFYPNTSSSFVTAWLITPAMNLAGVTEATLSFSYVNAVWAGGQDELYVYYRVNNGEWTLLESYTDNQATWTDETITLTGLADNYQIGFYGTNMDEGDGYDYGYGIGIDNVSVAQMLDAGTWQNTTSATESKQLTGLAAGTKYDVQVQGVCGGTAGSWSTPIYSFPTLPFTKTITGVGNDNWDEQNGGYYLIASPVTNAITPSADNGFVTSNYDLYAFDQSEELEWRNYNVLVETEMTHPNFTTIENGKGYLYASKTNTTLSFTGEVNTNGTVTLSKSGSGNLAGWNLVGTPFGEDAYITKPFYTLENSNTFTSNVAGTAIHAMQGLFVVADNDGETLTFMTEAPSKSAKLNMNLRSGDKQLDNAILVFGGEQQLGKFSFSANSSKIYMPVEGKEYAVATAEGNVGEMPVSFKAEKNGSYTLSFTNEEVTFSYLHLIDNMTGNDVNLLETPNYTFEARTSDYANRFRLVFATGSSVDGDSFGFVNASGNLCIFGIEGEATVQVIDMLGHVISSETFSGSYERKINGTPGVYLVRLINGNEVKVQKVVVR